MQCAVPGARRKALCCAQFIDLCLCFGLEFGLHLALAKHVCIVHAHILNVREIVLINLVSGTRTLRIVYAYTPATNDAIAEATIKLLTAYCWRARRKPSDISYPFGRYDFCAALISCAFVEYTRFVAGRSAARAIRSMVE